MTPRNDLKPQQQQEKPQGTAVAQRAPQRQNGLTFDQFVQEFDGAGRQKEITALLPSNVPFERFRSTAIAAVKQNPEILNATPRSVFNALTKAAQDGLLPDGREGFINVYGTVAQWMPMTWGIRKRARELDGMIIDAQVVYMEDRFEWHQGDEPRIVHVPAKLGKNGRGEKIGAYAIFKRENGLILHREVMDYGQIEKVKDQSKAKNGLLWTKFEDEAYRKSVVRRGSKTVPVSDGLRDIIQRGDEDFDFSQDHAAADPDIVVPPRPQRSDFEREPVAEGDSTRPNQAEDKPAQAEKPKDQAAPQGDPRPEPPAQGETVVNQDAGAAAEDDDGGDQKHVEQPHPRSAFDDWFKDQIKDLEKYELVRDLAPFYDSVIKELEGDDDRMRIFTAAYTARQDAIKKAKKQK